MAAVRNLTLREAVARAAVIDVESYDITLDLTDARDAATFPSRTIITFACRDTAASVILDISAETLRSVRLNGEEIGFFGAWTPQEGLTLSGLRERNVLEVEGDFAYTTSGQGLHRLTDPADGEVYLYSQFCTNQAPRAYACFDQPDLKAEFTWHVTVPEGWQAVTNMPAETTDGNTVHFARSPRMSTYHTALCAGPYHVVHDSHGGVELGLYCRASAAAYLEADDIFLITKQGLDFYGEHFRQPYPLPKYDQVLLPEFNAGGMENFGCVTYAEEITLFRSKTTDADIQLRAMVLLHELAHMWFGDLVTLRWWDDLWLNESFAEWASHWAAENATRFTEAWAMFLTTRKQWGYEQDQLSTTHPIYAAVEDVQAAELNFDGISYAKGASVIKQLVAYVGEDVFLAGLRDFMATHAWGNATFEDLLAALERASGRDLRLISQLWLRTAGVNTLRPVVSVAGGAYTQVEIRQEAPAGHPTLRDHRVAVGLYDVDGDTLVRRDRLMVEVAGDSVEVPELAGVRQPGVLLVNDDDLTYAKVRLDERSAATLTEHISGFERPLQRGLAWAGSWDMVKDAEYAPRAYITQIATGLPDEADPTLVSAVILTATRTMKSYVDPAWRAQGWELLYEASHRALSEAEPGSDRQLIWARLNAESARSAEQTAAVRGWLDGAAPDGLKVDADLRWHVIACLAAVAAVDGAVIESELSDDPTADGRRRAAYARAAWADAASKTAVWDRITSGEAANWELEASVTGFHGAGQEDLLAPFADRYFAELGAVFDRLDGEMARFFATGAFPRTQISEETVARVDEWLAAEQPQTLRRIVLEGRDRMVRALKARARDRA
jgi:aminopeptidase N